ncbi:MAG: aspartyl protease family protein [Planctomycetota bacterium]|jgi:hypothetical protein
MHYNRPIHYIIILILTTIIFLSGLAQADQNNWERKEVNWQMSGSRQIKAINYPPDKPPLTLARHKMKRTVMHKKSLPPKKTVPFSTSTESAAQPIFANVIDSPPIDGFVPWIVVSVTDERLGNYELDAVDQTYVSGEYTVTTPESNYAVGIFDTGASGHLISADDAFLTGIYGEDLVTQMPVTLIGATSTATAFTSFPLGIFVDSLDAVEPNGLFVDNSMMVGETNVSIIVGDPIGSPNLPTAIGSPLAVFFTAAFNNDNQAALIRDDTLYTGPDIRFYDHNDPCVPYYSNIINLNLKPEDVDFVQYFPCIEGIFDCPDGDGTPMFPSLIVDGWWQYQGLFFASSVDVLHGEEKSEDKSKFMVDTGAQVTVISSDIAARLSLPYTDPCDWDFSVDIIDATGAKSIAPGFYVDTFLIVGSPHLSFTNVPVIVLDVQYSGGGYLEGIIGMNLFVDLNFTFKGGGLLDLGQSAPYIRYEPVCRVPGDIAPKFIDCVVDEQDFNAMGQAWLSTTDPVPSANFNPRADLAPSERDGMIDLLDLSILSQHWLESASP